VGGEGAQIIPSLLERAHEPLLISVNGYLITISRVISFLALEIGGLEHYPATSTALGLVFTAAVFAWIGTAPLIVRGTWLLAAGSSLVPSDVEASWSRSTRSGSRGSPSSRWCSGGQDDRSRVSARVAVALVCGLSNPIVVPVALNRRGEGAATRARHDVIIAVALAIPGDGELWMIHASPGISAMPASPTRAWRWPAFFAYPCSSDSPTGPERMDLGARPARAALVGLLIPADSRRRRLALVGLFLLSAVPPSFVASRPH